MSVPPATAPDLRTRRSLPERAVDRAAGWLGRSRLTRRGFLGRAAVVGSALTLDPVGFLLRPRSAYATVCGADNECDEGWTAFCCTISDGENVCPPNAYAAGWWKVDDSDFCRGSARYYVDCNRRPEASCDCHCADGDCDRRSVCCNEFRYGQCNPDVGGTTEVVCRVVLCTPPWEWDEACTTTVRTDEETRSHSASCLPPANPSFIQIRYQDLGLAAAPVGTPTSDERDGADDGRIRAYTEGYIAWSPGTGAHHVAGASAALYEELGLTTGRLGYPVEGTQPSGQGEVTEFEHGTIWASTEHGTHATWGVLDERFRAEGGPDGWLGWPTTDVRDAPGDRLRIDFAAGWSIAADPATGATRVLPVGTPLPDEGWPPQAQVRRWSGDDRIATAVAATMAAFPDGVRKVFLARADDFADALAGGAAAGAVRGALLLTFPDELPDETFRAVSELAPQEVVLLGGPTAIHPEVERRLRDELDAEVSRLGGQDRYDTAATVSREVFGDVPDEVYLATGLDFPDALAASAPAASRLAPVLLTPRSELADATRDELARLRPRTVFVLGGTAAISERVAREADVHADRVVRVAGEDRYATAAELVSRNVEETEHVVVATGQEFPDALAGGPIAAELAAPIALVAHEDIPDPIGQQLLRLGPTTITVLGGPLAVSEEVARRLSYYPVRQDQDSGDDGA